MYNEQCEALLAQWCETMLSLQIKHDHTPGLYGGILCPACGRVHGRCMDAIYPFLFMADKTGDAKWVEGAKLLFDWGEQVVSREEGSYVNDTNSDWRGITVFSVIQLCEALKYHAGVLDEATAERWKARIRKAADFLTGFAAIYNNNVNYRITNALAMQHCGALLNEPRYLALARSSAQSAVRFLTQRGLLFGEGRPGDGYSPRGCRAVDIGYNVEESLPSLAAYADMTGDDALAQEVTRAMAAQLHFMLPDGAWDNSFGTRNFKWTYWGSRTSDGCLLGYLLMAQRDPSFLTAAQRNLTLLARCTHGGLLCGGLHYHSVGERPCVHHTFTHAKVLAGLLDHGLSLDGKGACLPREIAPAGEHFSDIDTYLLRADKLLATVTCYDWEYLPGGHASGGNITMLWHPAAGPVLCATMSEYCMKEVNNQQLPRFERHECLSPALAVLENGVRYTTLYDFHAQAEMDEAGSSITVHGQVMDIAHNCAAQPLRHVTQYHLAPDALSVSIALSRSDGVFICPLVCESGEAVSLRENSVILEKPKATVTLTVEAGTLSLPYGAKRCYNLVAGMQALKTEIAPVNGSIRFSIRIRPKSDPVQ